MEAGFLLGCVITCERTHFLLYSWDLVINFWWRKGGGIKNEDKFEQE